MMGTIMQTIWRTFMLVHYVISQCLNCGKQTMGEGTLRNTPLVTCNNRDRKCTATVFASRNACYAPRLHGWIDSFLPAFPDKLLRFVLKPRDTLSKTQHVKSKIQ
eukprot:645605_1